MFFEISHICFGCVRFQEWSERSWNLTLFGHEKSWNLNFQKEYEPCSYLRNEWPNIHKTGIDGQAIWQGFQICNLVQIGECLGALTFRPFVMTLTLWITWFLDDLSWNLISHMLSKTYKKIQSGNFFYFSHNIYRFKNANLAIQCTIKAYLASFHIIQALLWHVHVKTCQRSAWMMYCRFAF